MNVNSFYIVTRKYFLKCFSSIMLQSKCQLSLLEIVLNFYYMLFVTSRHYILEDSVLNLSEKSVVFNKAYEVSLRPFLNVEANEQL
jgi:hypothetical protein